jgi:hypothetical protein
MKKRYDEGGDVMEAANASAESQEIAKSVGAINPPADKQIIDTLRSEDTEILTST